MFAMSRLPGKAYAKRQHTWLTRANEVDSKVFSRAILAKTVVCIPLLDGVVELGTTERVQEDLGLIQQVQAIFVDGHQPLNPPKPALSQQSTSDPATSSRFHSPTMPAMYARAAAVEPPANANQMDEEEEEEEEEEEADSDSEAETDHNSRLAGVQPNPLGLATTAEPSELMQLDMSEDIRLGSPDDGSNNLDTDFHLLAVSQAVNNPSSGAESCRAESTRRWPLLADPLSNITVQPVSTILQHQSTRWSASPASAYVAYSNQSAFTSWITTRSDHRISAVDGTSQWLLKYILFSVPFLHTKYREDAASPKFAAESASRFRKGTPQDELSANHVLAERRRREKLNERFIILRSLVPFVTKMDKASILGDTIEYVKQLRKKIQDLEARTRQMEVDQRSRSVGDAQKTSDKRKMRIVEGGVGGKPKPVEQPPPPPAPAAKPMEVVAVAGAGDVLQVEVSIIESDALVELQCPYNEGLLLDVMQKLRELRVEITAVQSSLNNGVFAAEMRAKVKENINGKKLSIVEVKRAINQIIHQH
ncbi:hypothetical protein RJ639_023087 [Escallonia herrerae]|uniref:BHLH domain-containing protein n=1 Tax=Escallonia herrerae TaxID=1293975 RepID=A0AA88V009_9ASTE|nr:hypothetical protein RJ639_023087 [Escallonia herrerae]